MHLMHFVHSPAYGCPLSLANTGFRTKMASDVIYIRGCDDITKRDVSGWTGEGMKVRVSPVQCSKPYSGCDDSWLCG